MGDSPDGSSLAQDAGEPSESSSHRGFFGRLIDALSPSDSTQGPATVPPSEKAPPGAAMPGVVNLRRLRVGDIAIPKAEIAAVAVTTSLEDLIKAFRDSGFSRLPVFKGTLDSPIGLIHLKDLALQQAFTSPKPRFSLRKLLRPLLYAPPSMPAATLLQKMQRDRVHMALVIDEYGGVDGLVTIEDLIETVIGEIDDEHDEQEGALWKEENRAIYRPVARAA